MAMGTKMRLCDLLKQSDERRERGSSELFEYLQVKTENILYLNDRHSLYFDATAEPAEWNRAYSTLPSYLDID